MVGLTPLCMRRLRSTWLTSVAETIGLHAFMEAAGVDCSQRLGDIISSLPPIDEAESVRLLSGTNWSRQINSWPSQGISAVHPRGVLLPAYGDFRVAGIRATTKRRTARMRAAM